MDRIDFLGFVLLLRGISRLDRYSTGHIDDSKIETEGFERETFEFSLDQRRILDLLTGHTLYNNTDVAIRELVQNSIDAIRLYKEKSSSDNNYSGKINIEWNSNEDILSIKDNGTGMTKDIIEKHLLTVGSSRYQDEQFKEEYPDFQAISEFGIGILSTFMIADDVEILTYSHNENIARQISFRSVHGRYLLRHIEEGDPGFDQISPHGTIVRLKIRPSVDLGDIPDICRKWFSTPPCEIELDRTNHDSVKIGYDTLSAALKDYVKRNSEHLDISSESEIQIEEKEKDRAHVCYAVKKKDPFEEWELLEGESEDIEPLGISIEGVRVTFSTPGFEDKPVVAMANLTGSQRPRTNVARTEIKSGAKYRDTLLDIYQSYLDHLSEQIQSLHKDKSRSLSWAVTQSREMMSPLTEGNATNSEIFEEAVFSTPLYLIECDSERSVESQSQIERYDSIWTIDSPFFRKSDELLRELTVDRSYQDIVTELELSYADLPEDPIVCNIESYIQPRQEHRSLTPVLNRRDPLKIAINRREKRIDIKWETSNRDRKWKRLSDFAPGIIQMVDEHDWEVARRRNRLPDNISKDIYLQNAEIETEGITDEIAIVSARRIFLLKEAPITQYFLQLMADAKNIDKAERNEIGHIIQTIEKMVSDENEVPQSLEDIKPIIGNREKLDTSITSMSEYYNAIAETEWSIFNPNICLMYSD